MPDLPAFSPGLITCCRPCLSPTCLPRLCPGYHLSLLSSTTSFAYSLLVLTCSVLWLHSSSRLPVLHLGPHHTRDTLIVAKFFERLVKQHIISRHPATLDPLHLSLAHLENKNSYVFMFLIYFSSTFISVIPQHLVRQRGPLDTTPQFLLVSWLGSSVLSLSHVCPSVAALLLPF